VHEFSIAQSLLNIVLEEAAFYSVGKIIKVTVKVGTFINIVPDSLCFCFDLIKQNTLAAEAVLELNIVPMAGHCYNCKAKLNFSEPIFSCPYCKSNAIKVIEGHEFCIEYIETA